MVTEVRIIIFWRKYEGRTLKKHPYTCCEILEDLV